MEGRQPRTLVQGSQRRVDWVEGWDRVHMISKLILVLPTLVMLMGIMLKRCIASVRAQLKHLKVVVLTKEMPALLRNPCCRTVDTIIITRSEVAFPSLTLVLGTPGLCSIDKGLTPISCNR